MSSPFPNGTYKLWSVAYKNQVADLHAGQPTGIVEGWQNIENHPNQNWTLDNVGPNQITLLNASSTTYAQVVQAIVGETVTGGDTSTTWTLVETKPDEYLITVGDGQLAWQLTGASNDAPIVLKPAVKSDPTQNWTFQQL